MTLNDLIAKLEYLRSIHDGNKTNVVVVDSHNNVCEVTKVRFTTGSWNAVVIEAVAGK